MNTSNSNHKYQLLEHPTTLKLFLYIKSKDPENVGIREVKRATNMNSTSTVSRHLYKLIDIGVIKKLPSNRFILTKQGEQLKDFKVPLKLSASVIKGRFISITSYLVSFLCLMIISTIILLVIDKLLAAINGLTGLILGLVIAMVHWREIRVQMRTYRSNLEVI